MPEPPCIPSSVPPAQGENALHLAITNSNLEMAELLVEKCPALLRQRAVGRFFSPGNPCYYGELPLSFAASTNQVFGFGTVHAQIPVPQTPALHFRLRPALFSHPHFLP